MMTHEHFQKVTQRIIELQQMEKEFGVEKMGASLQYELHILMQDVQDYVYDWGREAENQFRETMDY